MSETVDTVTQERDLSALDRDKACTGKLVLIRTCDGK